MKKWNNPELMILGVENTREELDDYSNKHSGYCHATGNDPCDVLKQYHADDMSSATNEKTHWWTGNQCSEHNDKGNTSCCCLHS